MKKKSENKNMNLDDSEFICIESTIYINSTLESDRKVHLKFQEIYKEVLKPHIFDLILKQSTMKKYDDLFKNVLSSRVSYIELKNLQKLEK